MGIRILLSTFGLLVLVTQCLLFAHAQNVLELKSDLAAAGIDAEFPDTPGYVNASLPYNRRYKDIHPFGIAYPAGANQVSIALQAATKQGLKVATRSGGHSYTAGGLGTTDGHFVLDMTRNTETSYNKLTGIATIGTGLRIGNLALFLNEHGRAMPHGRCSFVGIGGHAGHGGWGHHSRMYGLFVDVIVEATVVTADGVIHTVSRFQNPELFWAIRGAASSFGILTQLKVRTFPQPPEATVFTYSWGSISAPSAVKHLAAFQEFVMHNITSKFGGEIVFRKGEAEGEVVVELFGGYWDAHKSFESTLTPYLEQFPTAKNVSVFQGTYFEGLQNWVYLPLNTTGRPNVPDLFYAKSISTPEQQLMSPRTMSTFVEFLATEGFKTNTSWFAEVELYGGKGSAINAIPSYSAAYPHRSNLFTFQLYASSDMSKAYPDEGFSFVNGVADSITQAESATWPWSAYVGYPDENLQDWQSRYFHDHYPLLRDLKAKYDPMNSFSFPLSIEPAQ